MKSVGAGELMCRESRNAAKQTDRCMLDSLLALGAIARPIQVVLCLSSDALLLQRVPLLEMSRMRTYRQVGDTKEMFGGNLDHLNGVEILRQDLSQDPVHSVASVLPLIVSESY